MRPADAVVRRFGGDAEPVLLPGGQGATWRAGSIILKPAPDDIEAAWAADVFEHLEGPGFRVPRPVRIDEGGWTFEGWCAWEYLDAKAAGPNGGRWAETLATCLAFHRALEGVPCPAFLSQRDNPWARADRMTFGEPPLVVSNEVRPLAERLTAAMAPLEQPEQLIHGDFTGNVLFAPGQPPAVIDFSPYWRPASFAAAVIAVDGLAWGGMTPAELRIFDDVPDFPQAMVRAALRRLLEFDLMRTDSTGLDRHTLAVEAALGVFFS